MIRKRSTHFAILGTLALSAGFFFGAASAQAQQTDFKMDPGEETVTYTYQWKDQYDTDQNLSFVMPKENVLASALDFDQSGIEHMRKRVHMAIQRYAKGYKHRMGLEVQFDDADRLVVYGNFKTQGERDRMVAALENLRQRTMYEYMQENMVTMGPYDQLVPDVARVSHEYAKFFTPLVPELNKKVGTASDRSMANFVAGLVQTIPSPKKGFTRFTLPLSTMTLNRGSYASKAAVYGAIMRALYPQMRMITLNLKDRIYIGLAIQPRDTDYTLKVYDNTFVIVDPNTGRPLEVGNVAFKADEKEQYTYFEIPRDPA
ncbi:MAG: hypothetical protein GC134_06765 [Proteobacteria bacterium]|nr:hypothetical protein [Pseudomonadota bacterium]